MTEPFMGELRAFGFPWVPRGWAYCAGQLVAINQNQALYSLLGTTYGGDGVQTFALPDLRGRTPVGQGQGAGLTPVVAGEMAGEEQVTLIVNEIPAHNHLVGASSTATTKNPSDNLPAPSAAGASYAATSTTVMSTAMITPTGGSQPHENRPPYLGINWCIALQGIYPSRD